MPKRSKHEAAAAAAPPPPAPAPVPAAQTASSGAAPAEAKKSRVDWSPVLKAIALFFSESSASPKDEASDLRNNHALKARLGSAMAEALEHKYFLKKYGDLRLAGCIIQDAARPVLKNQSIADAPPGTIANLFAVPAIAKALFDLGLPDDEDFLTSVLMVEWPQSRLYKKQLMAASAAAPAAAPSTVHAAPPPPPHLSASTEAQVLGKIITLMDQVASLQARLSALEQRVDDL